MDENSAGYETSADGEAEPATSARHEATAAAAAFYATAPTGEADFKYTKRSATDAATTSRGPEASNAGAQ